MSVFSQRLKQLIKTRVSERLQCRSHLNSCLACPSPQQTERQSLLTDCQWDSFYAQLAVKSSVKRYNIEAISATKSLVRFPSISVTIAPKVCAWIVLNCSILCSKEQYLMVLQSIKMLLTPQRTLKFGISTSNSTDTHGMRVTLAQSIGAPLACCTPA